MLAPAFAAVPTLEVVLFRENDKTIVGVIEIFWIEFFLGHVLSDDFSKFDRSCAVFSVNCCVECLPLSSPPMQACRKRARHFSVTGRDGKGMVAWKSELSAQEIAQVASYVISLEGTNPTDPKAPEGEIWEAETE